MLQTAAELHHGPVRCGQAPLPILKTGKREVVQVPYVDTEGVKKGVQTYCTHTLTRITLKELRQQPQLVWHLCLDGQKACFFIFVKLNIIELTRLKMLPSSLLRHATVCGCHHSVGACWEPLAACPSSCHLRLNLRVCSAIPDRGGVTFWW